MPVNTLVYLNLLPNVPSVLHVFDQGSTVYWIQKYLISITRLTISPVSVQKPTRRRKKLPKSAPKPAAEATQAHKICIGNQTQKSNFLRLVLFGRFGVFEPWDLEIGRRLYIYIYIDI